MSATHSVRVSGERVTAVRALIEARLGVETICGPAGDKWCIVFTAPKNVDLDFLRPDVLPPTKPLEGL